MNVFLDETIARSYDEYYKTEFGQRVDRIEKELIDSLLEGIRGGHMLELGCGTGHWTAHFLEAGFQVTAIDASEPMLRLAREKNLAAKFIQADAANLPFPDHSFKIVTAVTVLEFVEDQQSVIEEIDRVLQPGGCFILGALNEESLLGKTRAQDPLFSKAVFHSRKNLEDMLAAFGEIEYRSGVYLGSQYELLDETEDRKTVEPAFMALKVTRQALQD